MSKQDDIALGDHAEAIMNNPAVKAAFARMRAKRFDQWMNTGFFQGKERKELWRQARAVDELENEFALMIQDANLSKK